MLSVGTCSSDSDANGREAVEGAGETPGEFVPTEQWQEILEGQTVPPGLHYRISMKTGKKFAKLLSEDEEVVEDGSVHGSDLAALQVTAEDAADSHGQIKKTPIATEGTTDADISDKNGNFNADMAKKVLLGLPNPDPSLLRALSSTGSLSKEEMDALIQRVWERRQREIEKAAAEMVTPADTISRLLRELPGANDVTTNVTQSARAVSILEELESMLDDIDNAGDFQRMGGLLPVIRLLNSTAVKVRAHAAWVIGTASKGLLRVQAEAVELGALNLLSQMIEAEFSDSATCAAHQKALYAIGAILRHYSVGQREFQRLGGDAILGRLMRRIHMRDGADVASKVLSILGKTAAVVGDLEPEFISKSLSDEQDAMPWCEMMLDTVRNVSAIVGRYPALRPRAAEAHEKILRATSRIGSSAGLRCVDTAADRQALTETLRLYEAWDDADSSFAETGYSESIATAIRDILSASEAPDKGEL